MRVLIFGDSITQGYWDTGGGWVERVRKHYDSLQVADLDGRTEPTVFNLGISGDNSAGILKRIVSETAARTFHGDLPAVVIQIGTNDASTDSLAAEESVSVPIEQYEQNLRDILQKIKPLSSKVIFVGLSACDESRTTPVSWGDYYYTNRAIQLYENKLRHIADELQIPFIPLFDRFEAEIHKGKNLLLDGLHPSNEGHAFMSDLILKDLTPQLRATT